MSTTEGTDERLNEPLNSPTRTSSSARGQGGRVYLLHVQEKLPGTSRELNTAHFLMVEIFRGQIKDAV